MFPYPTAALATFCLLLFLGINGEGEDVELPAVCKELAECVKDYNVQLKPKLIDANNALHQNYSYFFNIKLSTDTLWKRKVMKYEKELEKNGCDFVPLNTMPCRYPYQAAIWYGLIYGDFNYYYGTKKHTEELPELKLVADCAKSLKVCRQAYKNMKNYIARKEYLIHQIDRVNNNQITKTLANEVEELELKINNRTHCPQNFCRGVQVCTAQYERKQRDLELVYIGRYKALEAYYNTSGIHMRMKDYLALLIHQKNASLYSHCDVIPSSERLFSSPYEAAFNYANKYLHVAPTGCTLANRNLPPIPGSTSCAVMEKTCNAYLVQADETIAQQRKELAGLNKLLNTGALTSETNVLRESIENLEKDVKEKFISHPCTKCDRVEACHEQYLELQDSLDEVNQQIHTQYMEKFEKDDIGKVVKEKVDRMKLKTKNPCNIVPVSKFDYIFNSNKCYWNGYAYGITLLQPTHAYTPYFERLSDLSHVVGNCTKMLTECQGKLNCGSDLLNKKKLELGNLWRNTNAKDISKQIDEYEDVKAKYEIYKDFMCDPDSVGDWKCAAELQECKMEYNSLQGKLDAAKTKSYNEFVEYYEINGMMKKFESLIASLNEQIGNKCEILPDRPSKIYAPPYHAPHEYTTNYGLHQLDIFYVHSENGSLDCKLLLSQCKKLVDIANYRINETKNLYNYLGASLNPKNNKYFIDLEIKKITKELELIETISKNYYCRQVRPKKYYMHPHK